MSICSDQLMSQLTDITLSNNTLLTAILDALLDQNNAIIDQAVTIGETCFKTDADEPEVLVTVVTISDGAVKDTIYTYPDGTPYTGNTPVATDPCDCPCLTCTPDAGVLWTVDNPDASWATMTDWSFDSVPGSLPDGDNGTGLTAFETALTGAGYIVTNAGNSPLIVKEATTTGKPTNFKWGIPNGQSFVNDWVLV